MVSSNPKAFEEKRGIHGEMMSVLGDHWVVYRESLSVIKRVKKLKQKFNSALLNKFPNVDKFEIEIE